MRSRSSSPDVPLVNLKRQTAALHGKSGSPVEKDPDVNNDGQKHSQLTMPHFASPTSPFPWPHIDALQPVLTSLDSLTTSRLSHAAKRPPHVTSTQSSRSSSPSPQAKARGGCPPLYGCGGKRPAVNGKGQGRGKGWGSKHFVSPNAGDKDHSPSSTSTNSTDVEESVKSSDDSAEPHEWTTRNSADIDHGSRRSFPISCIRDTSIHASSLSSAEPAIHITSPQNSITPNPTALVSQLNLTSNHTHPQLSPDIVPHLGIDPLSTPFESHPFLNILEDPSSGTRLLGDIEQIIDGHFLESLTHGLYGSSTTSCLDSDLMPN